MACIEEIAYKLGYIEHSDLVKIAETMNKSSYGLYLKNKMKIIETDFENLFIVEHNISTDVRGF